MLRVEPQCCHVISRCSGVCMSISTQIFISHDLPVSPRSSIAQFGRSAAWCGHTRRASEESPSSTDLGMDTLVCALNGHEPISCSSSATPRLGASSSTKCEMSFRDSRISDEIGGDRRPRHESGVFLMKGCVTYNTPNPFRPHPKTHPHSQCWSSSPRNVFRTKWSHRVWAKERDSHVPHVCLQEYVWLSCDILGHLNFQYVNVITNDIGIAHDDLIAKRATGAHGPTGICRNSLSPGPTYYDILLHITTYYDISDMPCHIRHIRHVRHAQVTPRCCGRKDSFL